MTQVATGRPRRRTTLPRSTRNWSRGIVWSLIGLTSFAAIYASMARIENSATATGQLDPVGGITNVSAPFNGIVYEVSIKEGQHVESGQLLLKLLDEAGDLQLSDLKLIHRQWTQQVMLLAKQLGIKPATILSKSPLADTNTTVDAAAELSDRRLEVKLRQLSAAQELERTKLNESQQASDLAGLRRKLVINQSITVRMRKLVQQGALAKIELERQIEKEIEISTAVQRTAKEHLSAVHRIQESALQAAHIPIEDRKQVYSQYNNAVQQLAQVDHNLADHRQKIALQQVKAPVSGRVFQLSAKQGEVTGPSRPALQIVPETHLQAKVAIANKDISFVKVGMPVEVRINSLPFTDYGALPGRLVRVGAFSLPPDPAHPQDYFPAVVRLERNSIVRKGKSYKLDAGMGITALIKLNSRPAISVISDRIAAFFDSTKSIR